MKEENTKSRKRWIYYAILGICALLLIAGIVLTVYFVTESGNNMANNPPIEGPDVPGDPSGPSEPEQPEEPDEPSGGEEAVRFAAPIDCDSYSVVYGEIYENGTLGWWYRHKAVDFDAAAGTEVRAMADGTVEEVSFSTETGNLITVDHGNGLKTTYRFVEPIDGLEAGDRVSKGEKIGEVATAYGIEAFQGEHLHLEIMLAGDYVDPTDYLEPVLSEK
ncbi:MAG: M23 family metallopeptidase [Clostridia bacterium]|nr:M23 family metallopeptidase [Clostridia bacterium]